MPNPKRRDLIRQGFETYREKVLPKDAGEIQLIECERAFFAGAQWLNSVLHTMLDGDDELTENDESVLSALEEEMEQYPVFDQLRLVKPKGRVN